MTPIVTTEQIADLAIRVGEIAANINQQLFRSKVNGTTKMYLSLLTRQAIILKDLHDILISRTEQSLVSVFILARCLMDDFMIALYFETKEHSDDEIIRYLADSLNNERKTLTYSKDLNMKYFEGKGEGMITELYIEEWEKQFKDSEDYANYYTDDTKTKFKQFPSIAKLVKDFPEGELCRVNAHAFVLWSLYSKYVHHSNFSYRASTDPSVRKIEIEQLVEALSYVYKTISICSTQLNANGLSHEKKDPTNVFEEIMGIEKNPMRLEIGKCYSVLLKDSTSVRFKFKGFPPSGIGIGICEKEDGTELTTTEIHLITHIKEIICD